jgi:hypothetical protein
MKSRKALDRRRFLAVAGTASAAWVGRDWLLERPRERVVVYIDNTNSGATTLRSDRLRHAWSAAEHFLQHAPVGSQAEFFCTGRLPRAPESLTPFSPLIRQPGRLSRTAQEAMKAALAQSLQSQQPGAYSSIIEDCHTLLERDYDQVPVELILISDLQQFTRPQNKSDHRLSPSEYLTNGDLLQHPDQVLARFPPSSPLPRRIRVHYIPPKGAGLIPGDAVQAAWRNLFTAWTGGDPKRVDGLKSG